MKKWFVPLALVIAQGALAGTASAAPGDTLLASRADGPTGAVSEDEAREVGVSGDGRYVSFLSSGDNLSADDDNASSNVFVRDLVAGTTAMVARNDAGTAATSGSAQDTAMSADGSCAAFTTSAANLAGTDANSTFDVFVRRLGTNDTLLVSQPSGITETASDNGSREASVSADCRYVAFQSASDDLVSGEFEGRIHVFVRDLIANTTVLADGNPDANASNPSISADGRYVAFHTSEPLHADDTDNTDDVYRWDRLGNPVELVSRATGGANVLGQSRFPSISADGRYVAFESPANDYSDADTDSTTDVFVRDMQTGVTTFVSRADGVGGEGGTEDSETASITADGRLVAFQSDAGNLSGEDGSGVDVFVRDLAIGTTSWISRASGLSAGGSGDSELPVIAAAGTAVAFESEADLGFMIGGITQAYVRDLGIPAAPPPPPGGGPQPPPAPPPGPNGPGSSSGPALGKLKASCVKPKRSKKLCRVMLSAPVRRTTTLVIDVARLAGRKPRKLGTLRRTVRPPRARLLLPAKIKGKRIVEGRYRLTVKLTSGRKLATLTVRVR